MSGQARRIDALPFFGAVVHRIAVRYGSTLATGKQHVTLELDGKGLTPRHVGILRNASVICPACGSSIEPFRARKGRKTERTPETIGRMFVSVSCCYADSPGCARGKAASAEIARLVSVILAAQKPPTTPPAASPAPPVKAAPLSEPPRSNEPNQLGLRGFL